MPWTESTPNIDVQRQLDAPMPCIGMYVAAASSICTLAMAADAFHGFRTKKYWFPSKYFSLNATSFTLLAVALKLPVDLTTRMYAARDRLSKVSSLVLMSTAMANFLTSLGSMDDKDILMNVTALGILVITVTANVFIQVIQLHDFLRGRLAFGEEILAVCSTLVLLVMVNSSALMLPSTKRYLETKYQEMHQSALNEEREMGRVNSDKLRTLIKKYWVMAETSSPQFVIARSVTCTSSGAICLMIALVLFEAEIRMAREHRIFDESDSNYGWSTRWILITQTIGVLVGSIAPISRWFIAISFRSSKKGSKRIEGALRVEGYWTQKMVDWKQGSLSIQIRHLRWRKFVHDVRGLILKFCICVQFLTVLASKLALLISVCVASPAIFCFNYVRKLKKQKQISDSGSSRNHGVLQTSNNFEMDIRHYVMLLEGEDKLPKETLESISKEIDKVISQGKKQKPRNLLKLLHKSRPNFRGVLEFDSDGIPSLYSPELPYCWSLSIVTLTSIAIALPNIEKLKIKFLMYCVAEGLPLVKCVDKNLDKKKVSLVNIRNAADVVWVGVELYRKWQDKDLHESSLKGTNSKEVLLELSKKSERTVLEFTRDVKDCLMKNPLNWPAKIMAANSMYRISRTLLMACEDERDAQMDERVFEKICIMIADIMAACLTNLSHVITMKCHRNAIEEREESVRRAALLLGESEEILAFLEGRELLNLNLDLAAYIEEWRALMKLDSKNKQSSISNSRPNISIDDSEFREEHVVAIEVDE